MCRRSKVILEVMPDEMGQSTEWVYELGEVNNSVDFYGLVIETDKRRTRHWLTVTNPVLGVNWFGRRVLHSWTRGI